jgi:hypothetical protein
MLPSVSRNLLKLKGRDFFSPQREGTLAKRKRPRRMSASRKIEQAKNRKGVKARSSGEGEAGVTSAGDWRRYRAEGGAQREPGECACGLRARAWRARVGRGEDLRWCWFSAAGGQAEALLLGRRGVGTARQTETGDGVVPRTGGEGPLRTERRCI